MILKRPPGIAEAIASLKPGAVWVCGIDYPSLEWLDEVQTKPTEEEVNLELQRLQELYIFTEYQRLRDKAYPTIEEQLDMLFHLGYDGWKAQIQAIKDQYPKPTE
jgi:hypothetical protein